MKKYPASLTLGICALMDVASTRAAGVVEGAVKRGTLWVGMDPIYMPFEMTNKRGQIIGFGADLLKAMAKSMDVKPGLTSTSCDDTIPALLIDKFDMTGSSMTLTQERNLHLNFFEPFIVVNQTLLVHKKPEGEIKSYKDLNDPQYSITSKIGTTDEIATRKLISEVKYYDFDNEPEAVMDVVSGKADAFIYGSPYNAVAVSKFSADKLTYLDQPLTYEPLTFSLRRDDYDNISFISNFPHQIREGGTYQRIRDRWFKNIEWLREME